MILKCFPEIGKTAADQIDGFGKKAYDGFIKTQERGLP